MYNSLWVWQLACLGSVAQAARFMMVCMAAARSAEMQPTPQSGKIQPTAWKRSSVVIVVKLMCQELKGELRCREDESVEQGI
eukprot:scaffold49673_cov23-Tisochrysis_lutea.AAC.1